MWRTWSTIPLLPLLLLGCAAPREATHRVTGASARTIEGVAPRYQPQFYALRDAVEAHDDQVARRIAAQLRARLDAAGDGPQSDVGDDALALLAGFDRILRGRELVDALQLELDVREMAGSSVEVFLRARTLRKTRMELRPGAASLRIHRVTLSPSDGGGKEGRIARTQGVGNVESLVLDSEGTLELSLGRFSTLLPGNALAARTRWSLHLLSGEILEEGASYPAMDVAVRPVERVDLAPFLPTAPVDPAELAAYADRPDGSSLALFERTVRILPERREEALDLLTEVVGRMTEEQIERLVPTLRWLSTSGHPGRDPAAWKAWLERRARGEAERAAEESDELDWGLDR